MDYLPIDGISEGAPGTPGNPFEILIVIPGRDFSDDEYFLSRRVFDEEVSRSGGTLAVRVVSSGSIRARGTGGTWVEIDRPMTGLDLSRCRALVFIGGAGAGEYSGAADRLAVEAEKKGCVVGAICAAPAVLARAGLLDMKLATSHSSVRDRLLSGNAVWSDDPVVVSGGIVTANGPMAATAFAEEIVRIVRSR